MLDFECSIAEGCDAGCAFAEAVELAFAPDGAAFACSLDVATLVATVFLAVAVLPAESCASPVAGDKQRQRNARTQGAPNLPVTFLARCFGSKRQTPKIRQSAPEAKIKAQADWHCHHPLSDDATPVPVGSFQVTEVSPARRWFHLAATNRAGGRGIPRPDHS